jgi:plasmid stabilization system protein ParE
VHESVLTAADMDCTSAGTIGFVVPGGEPQIPLFARHAGCLLQAMPASRWSSKDERQYEHIKDSNEERGMSARKATEIAARTVNKRRREEGRTQNRRTMGTGNPNQPLAERTRDEIYNIAQDLNVRGRSKMTKSELIEAVRHERGRG